MKSSMFPSKILLWTWTVTVLLCTAHVVQSIEIECIPLKSCPLMMELMTTKRIFGMTDFVKNSHCGFDEWSQPKVWCSKLDFCKTPDGRNGTCTLMKKCKPFLELMATLDTSNSHNQYYLDQFRCNRILEDVHVCCSTESTADFDRERSVTETSFLINPGKYETRNRFDYSEEDYPNVCDDDDDTSNISHDRNFVKNDNHGHYHKYDRGRENNNGNHMGNIPEDSNRRSLHSDHDFHNNNNGNERFTTPKGKVLTTRKRTTPSSFDRSAILFEDSSEEFDSPDYVGSTTARTSTKRTTARTSTSTSGKINKSRRTTTTSPRENKKACETPDRKAGICMKMNDCQPYLKLRQNLDKSKTRVKQYLSKFRCASTNSRENYVCCETELKDIDNTVLERNDENDPEHISKVCGRQTANTDKIFGGKSASLGEFPWLALLKYPSKNKVKFACGGTLISSRHVLTAAHCVEETILKRKQLGQVRQVVLGEYDTRNKTDCFYTEFGAKCADPPKIFGVESITRYKTFRVEVPRDDIAIIKLNQEVKFTDYIKPACLPTKTLTLKGNETFLIAGWGRTPTESFSPVLKKASVPYVQTENCNDRSPRSRQLVESQVCVGLGNGVDSCNGDSGGPLMQEEYSNSEFVTYVMGVISYGFGECGTGPSVNTYVPYYTDWIKENIK